MQEANVKVVNFWRFQESQKFLLCSLDFFFLIWLDYITRRTSILEFQKKKNLIGSQT